MRRLLRRVATAAALAAVAAVLPLGYGRADLALRWLGAAWLCG